MLRTTDRVPTKALSNGAIRYGIYDDKGALIRYEYIKREDEPSVQGDAINRALFEDFLDVGTIVQTDADLSNDDRFLPCNGIFLQPNDYPELYSKIGHKYEEAFPLYQLVGDTRTYGFYKGDFDRGIINLSERYFGGFYRNKDFVEDNVFIFEEATNENRSYYIHEIVGYEDKYYGYAVDEVLTNDVIRFNSLIIVANGSGIYTTDGTDHKAVWTSRLATKAYAFAYNNNIAIAVCTDGTNSYIYSSTNGTTWTKRVTGNFAMSSASFAEAKYKDGIFLVRMSNKSYRSTNGINWEETSTSIIGTLYNTNKYFVFTQSNGIVYSEDGTNWSTKDLEGATFGGQTLGQLVVNDKFYDIDGGFRIPLAKGRWIKVK